MRQVRKRRIEYLLLCVLAYALFRMTLQGTFARYFFSVNTQFDLDAVQSSVPVHTIHYETNGGTLAANSPTTIREGQQVTLLDPTRTNYTFAGWYNNSSFTGNAITVLSNVSGDVYLWAKWSMDVTDITYVISGDSDGSTYLNTNVSSSNPVNIRDLVGHEYVGANLTNKVINRVDVVITFTTSTGSSQSSNVVLTYNNTPQTQSVQFRGKQNNQTVTASFTGLSIGIDETFTVQLDGNGLTNGNVAISGYSIQVYFATRSIDPNMLNAPMEFNSLGEFDELLINDEIQSDSIQSTEENYYVDSGEEMLENGQMSDNQNSENEETIELNEDEIITISQESGEENLIVETDDGMTEPESDKDNINDVISNQEKETDSVIIQDSEENIEDAELDATTNNNNDNLPNDEYASEITQDDNVINEEPEEIETEQENDFDDNVAESIEENEAENSLPEVIVINNNSSESLNEEDKANDVVTEDNTDKSTNSQTGETHLNEEKPKDSQEESSGNQIEEASSYKPVEVVEDNN